MWGNRFPRVVLFFLRLHPTLAAVDLTAARYRIFLDGQRGLVPDQFALTPDRRSLLAWTVSCPGLAYNYCAAELHRIALEDGSDQIVLRARLGPASPVAGHPSGPMGATGWRCRRRRAVPAAW